PRRAPSSAGRPGRAACGLIRPSPAPAQPMAQNHVARYFEQVAEVARKLDHARIQALVDELVQLRERQGRLFILGVGGSAGNASHAVNDFRKLCGIETYAPTDNVSELTARINDEGWEGVFEEWL